MVLPIEPGRRFPIHEMVERLIEIREDVISPPPIEYVTPPQQDILKLAIGTIFPPAAAVLQFPEGGVEVIKEVPKIVMETAFPITSAFTGELPVETFLKAETARQVAISPLSPVEKREVKEKYMEAWEEAKPAPVIVSAVSDIELPEFKFPDILGGLKDVGKYALIAGGLIVAAYLFTRKK